MVCGRDQIACGMLSTGLIHHHQRELRRAATRYIALSLYGDDPGLRASVDASRREDWIAEQLTVASTCSSPIPELVKTGLTCWSS